MMNWEDTIGQYIHAKMAQRAMEIRPSVEHEKIHDSIKRSSITVGIVRDSIADVLDAEIETMIAYRTFGDRSITLDFLSGMLAAADLVRSGTHVSDSL